MTSLTWSPVLPPIIPSTPTHIFVSVDYGTKPTTVVTIVAAIALVAILTIKEEIVSAPPFGEPPSEVVVLHTLSICVTETSMYHLSSISYSASSTLLILTNLT